MVPFHRSWRAVCAALCIVPALFAQEPAASGKKLGPFSIEKEAERLPVISQDSTGTCWSFGTASFFESEIQRQSGVKVDLSEMFFARHAIVEKARRAVEAGGATSFFGPQGLTQGGLSHDLTFLMKEYGAVPQEVYSGLLPGKKTHNHDELFKVVAGAIRGVTGADREGKSSRPARARKATPQFVAAIGAIADSYLGAPPAEFQYQGKTYTPKSFLSDVAKLNPDDYVQVMAYSTSAFGGKAKLDVPDNWLGYDQYENVDIDRFMQIFDGALAQGYTLALDADVSEKGFKTPKAIAVMSDEEEKNPRLITQETRDKSFADKSTTDDHLMHVVGVAKHEDGRRFYLTKNSWGEKAGPYGGYFLLSEAYIRAKALSVMVHKDVLKAKT
jgi:bleomycin hydrolase